jgi:putative effector of murein hydrolase
MSPDERGEVLQKLNAIDRKVTQLREFMAGGIALGGGAAGYGIAVEFGSGQLLGAIIGVVIGLAVGYCEMRVMRQ